MLPLAIRWPPNQSTATHDRFITPMTVGNANANMRFTRRPVLVSAPFASANRCCSWPVRMNARITRTPVICSRSTRLTRSILDCIDLNSGTAFAISISDSQDDQVPVPRRRSSWVRIANGPSAHKHKVRYCGNRREYERRHTVWSVAREPERWLHRGFDFPNLFESQRYSQGDRRGHVVSGRGQ